MWNIARMTHNNRSQIKGSWIYSLTCFLLLFSGRPHYIVGWCFGDRHPLPRCKWRQSPERDEPAPTGHRCPVAPHRLHLRICHLRALQLQPAVSQAESRLVELELWRTGSISHVVWLLYPWLRERRTVAMEAGCQNIQLGSTILNMAFPQGTIGPLFLFLLGLRGDPADGGVGAHRGVQVSQKVCAQSERWDWNQVFPRPDTHGVFILDCMPRRLQFNLRVLQTWSAGKKMQFW